jgi:hypothetical protein
MDNLGHIRVSVPWQIFISWPTQGQFDPISTCIGFDIGRSCGHERSCDAFSLIEYWHQKFLSRIQLGGNLKNSFGTSRSQDYSAFHCQEPQQPDIIPRHHFSIVQPGIQLFQARMSQCVVQFQMALIFLAT